MKKKILMSVLMLVLYMIIAMTSHYISYDRGVPELSVFIWTFVIIMVLYEFDRLRGVKRRHERRLQKAD